MRVFGCRATVLALVCAGVSAAACVPRGAPPSGRQIVPGRDSAPIGFVRPNGDGVTRVLVTRPGDEPSAVDLEVVAVDASGGPPVERVLAENLMTDFSAPPPPAGSGNCGGTDGHGRLLVYTGDEVNPQADLLRIDPLTGDRLDLGPVYACEFSSSGQQLFAVQSGSATLYDADDGATPLEATDGHFIGEDLYEVTSQGQLMRLSPGAAPQLLAMGVSFFSAQMTDAGPVLQLARDSPDQSGAPVPIAYSMLDLSTGQETPLPFLQSTSFSLSPDGRWFVTADWQTGAVTFVDWRTGAQQSAAIPTGAVNGYEWRPAHDEVWFSIAQGRQPSISIRSPGGAAFDAPLQSEVLNDAAHGGASSIFTADGAFWFSSRAPVDQPTILQIGSADDPTGPKVDLLPGGNLEFEYWRLADGRLLVPTWTNSLERTNIFAVDPTTGDARAFGEQGELLAVGQTRLLVNQHVAQNEGDLTVFALDIGEATVLAQEFTLNAFVEPIAADAVAPGAHVAFRFVARFPSEYDGIWLATVP